ncbi:hypothetical protein BCR41DRAFT_374089 [Lobosporangium transversale]|uniref:Uncharacterized protein n=1 Tax=Lobosporangium transversale TaxID=64571 RepID=A0A1Y2GFS6_9FUNG|nr:hypothetical protein BCR41DRAFT_374089 [Lobosporangium transversale]ORZ06368.1 hypothetical protein BCR41DRAFT_374089 [Lobosporangium transversale]|eukprot:XP_021877531.1 hypothetical protein BCR41DRAFT_374089 [Lobosporangium transversale]
MLLVQLTVLLDEEPKLRLEDVPMMTVMETKSTSTSFPLGAITTGEDKGIGGDRGWVSASILYGHSNPKTNSFSLTPGVALLPQQGGKLLSSNRCAFNPREKKLQRLTMGYSTNNEQSIGSHILSIIRMLVSKKRPNRNWNEYNSNPLTRNNWSVSLVPAAAVIPAPTGYIKVVAVKKLVVGFRPGWAALLYDMYCLDWVLPSGKLSCCLLSAAGNQDFYFEKIRGLKHAFA